MALFATRRLAALALTVVLAPTIVWTVFNGLRGTGGQPLYDVAFDYVVTTCWHFDLGTSPAACRRSSGTRCRPTSRWWAADSRRAS